MDAIIPWASWVAKITPHYPAGKRGRLLRGIEIMLRMYLLQIWFDLSDECLEDTIYDIYLFYALFANVNLVQCIRAGHLTEYTGRTMPDFGKKVLKSTC